MSPPPENVRLQMEQISKHFVGSHALRDATFGARARDYTAASTSEIARFETEKHAIRTSLSRLMDLSGRWIHRAHQHRKLTRITLDMDSSVSETYGHPQGSAYDGHFRLHLSPPAAYSTSSATCQPAWTTSCSDWR